jgi:RNA polymerase sigma factor (TIGR02999 family)
MKFRVQEFQLGYAAPMTSSISLTAQLRLYSEGFRDLGDSIFEEILPRLRQIATWKLANGKGGAAITPNDLVDEAWLTRLHKGNWKIESREHFFGIAGKAMQQALIDLARKEMAERRGGEAAHVSFEELSPKHQPVEADAEQVIAIGMLLDRLTKEDPMTALVVREHHVSGFELHEIAKGSGLSLRQVRYRWQKGKTWLATRLIPRQGLNVPSQDRE